MEESLRLELNCDGYDGIHSTVVCPYYINTGMFAGIGRSLIPVLTQEHVVHETIKAILVNQEVLCIPDINYCLLFFKNLLPAKSFLWAHRAIGAASTMKTFTGRTAHLQNTNSANQQQTALLGDNNGKGHVEIKMTPPDIGITIPPAQKLNQ